VPLAGAWVALIPEFANRTEKRLFQSAHSGTNGKFEFRGVAPGTYNVFSWDNVQEHDWDDAEFLKPFEHAAASITIAEGDAKTLDVTVTQVKNEGESPR